MRKVFFSINLIILALVVVPVTGIFGLFTDQSSALANTFSTAEVFTTPTPSPTLSPSPSPQVSTSPQPSTSPTPPPVQIDFPTCPKTPGATVNGKAWDVGYPESWHWIVFQGMKFGSDYVYFLDGKNKVLQCYYPVPRNDTGIQTNWFKKTESVSGWDEWLNGADFGLNSGPYLVKNIDFSTLESSPSPTPSSTPDLSETTEESSPSAEL